jgi:hypothetical protein
MPLWYKRAGSLFAPNTANESDIIAYSGILLCATFNRAPLASEVIFTDISDPSHPIELARRAWPGAMGSMLVDTAGTLHIYGSAAPAQNVAPFNSLIHSSVDAAWNLSPPNTIIGPSGLGFNNVGVCAAPGGYMLAVEQAYGNGNKAESFLFSADPSFASYTWKNALYNPGNPTVDFTGRSRLRYMADGWFYVTSDTATGYCRIARTRDFVSFKFASDAYGFLGPDIDVHPPQGASGGTPFYDGNVSWEAWTLNGAPCVYGIYFMSNEVDNGAVHLCLFDGTLAELFSKFSFPT